LQLLPEVGWLIFQLPAKFATVAGGGVGDFSTAGKVFNCCRRWG
jgi:hypothetical protein